MAELYGGQVDRYGEIPVPPILPGFQLRHSRSQYPFPYRNDLAVRLGNRDEFIWRDIAELRVLPSDQGFEADNPVVLERKLWLINQTELFSLHRPSEGIVDLEGTARSCLHFRCEEAIIVAPVLLGPIHGSIRTAPERIEIHAIGRINGNTDRNSQVDFVALDIILLRRDIQNPFSQIGSAIGIGTRKDQYEFIATEPGNGILVPDGILQSFSELFEQFVANAVSKGIVDVLEIVQIEEHQGQRLMAPVRQTDGKIASDMQQRPVRQAGQRIEMGQPLDTFFRFFSFGQIGKGANIVRYLVLGVPHGLDQ